MSSAHRNHELIIRLTELRRKQSRCNCKYRVRWFHSKGAILVLIWTVLWSAAINYTSYMDVLWKAILPLWIAIPLCISLVVIAPLSGWLADCKFGNYFVLRIGVLFMSLAAILACVCVLIFSNIPSLPTVVITLLMTAVYFFEGTGIAICAITSLQLGLDQMPDVSTTNITSFISWFVFCLFCGFWIGNLVADVSRSCLTLFVSKSVLEQVMSIFPTVCVCLVLCLDFCFAKKWLTIETKSPQSLKTAFRVLKFACKQRAPGAFMYWRENKPSRIDLGKSRYGGPFTTEQVENVKTILKILVATLPLWTIILSSDTFALNHHRAVPIWSSSCANELFSCFTYSTWWCAIIGTLFYEFAVYPFIKDRLPSILKRIGFNLFSLMVLNALYLTVYTLKSCQIVDDKFLEYTNIVQSVLFSLLSMSLFTSSLEFVCAQSPYYTRGLLASYIALVLFSSVASVFVLEFIIDMNTNNYRFVIYYSLKCAFSLFGFVLHCILARWYKRRVRDEVYHPQRVIEDVYDRYLSARP